MLVYAETGIGSCIREVKNLESGKRLILEEVGTYNGIQKIRKATKEDIAWVKAMGGYIPETTNRKQ